MPGRARCSGVASAWDALADELGSAAASFGSVTSRLTGAAWQGAASQAMAGAAAPDVAWLTAASVRAQAASAQAKSVASAFEAAQAATVHPVAVAANRNTLLRLVVSNLLGQNAPAIANAEAAYESMWAQDVAAMVGYHAGASTAAAQLPPWLQALESQAAGLNLGFGNTGSLNVGINNTGILNIGVGNTG